MLTHQVLRYFDGKKISGDHDAVWGAIRSLGEFFQLAHPCIILKTTHRYRGHLQRVRSAWWNQLQRSHPCQHRHPKRGSASHHPNSELRCQKFRRTISVVFHRLWRLETSIPPRDMSFLHMDPSCRLFQCCDRDGPLGARF